MAKIFDVNAELHENPNRNNFDLTHKRHVSGKFGYIYPFLAQPVVPTDSWEIDTAIGVNFMPMVYPIQSNMRFIVHYFYVPYRIMWKKWKNTIEGLEDETFPYIDAPASFYKTSSLADYLGIPTNFVVPSDGYYHLPSSVSRNHTQYYSADTSAFNSHSYPVFSAYERISSDAIDITTSKTYFVPIREPLIPISKIYAPNLLDYISFGEILNSESSALAVSLRFYGSDDLLPLIDDDLSSEFQKMSFLGDILLATLTNGSVTKISLTDEQINLFNAYVGSKPFVYALLTFASPLQGSSLSLVDEFTFDFPVIKGTNIEISSHPTYCPYYSTGNQSDTVKVNAFMFRAYEMVYNSFYRNSQGNQPFVVDGVTKYNEYLTTDESGADSTHYELKTRNWELDAYTSCLPSPQQGDAPIIAVDTTGVLNVRHDDGSVSRAQLIDMDGSAGVEVRNADIDIDHPEDARTIMRLSTSGMTIADFRQGNALTRFLEQSLRSGYKYADFIFGHFGSAPSHQELDMPVFLGGYTQVVDVNKISNVSAGDTPLGDFAGTASSFNSSNHSVKHYFDDFGVVMGLMMLVPDAAYSQVLPKHFTYSNRLDFYFPEFSQLGLQPITYEELCPIQSHSEYVGGDTSKLLTDTFGYQRPNHELVWLHDSLHGLFRTDLASSVINRRFGVRPELGDDFLRIHPEECNDVFAVTESNDDVWLGQVVVHITAKRPIPRVVVPSLGR